MFEQTRGDRSELNSTSGRKSSQGDTVPGKDGKLYRHTECYACHRYGIFLINAQIKKQKQLILQYI